VGEEASDNFGGRGKNREGATAEYHARRRKLRGTKRFESIGQELSFYSSSLDLHGAG